MNQEAKEALENVSMVSQFFNATGKIRTQFDGDAADGDLLHYSYQQIFDMAAILDSAHDTLARHFEGQEKRETQEAPESPAFEAVLDLMCELQALFSGIGALQDGENFELELPHLLDLANKLVREISDTLRNFRVLDHS